MTTIHVAAFVALSTIIHFLLLRSGSRRIFVSVLVLLGATLSVLAYQLWAYFDLGFLDPFFRVAAAVQFGISLLIGVIVALVLKARRASQVRG